MSDSKHTYNNNSLFVQLSGCCQDFHPIRKCCFPATLKVILIASEHSHCTFQSLPCCWWSRCGFFKIDFFFFIFWFPGPSYAKLCLEVHWAAQIRAWRVDVGLQGESDSVSGCRDPADSTTGKPQVSGAHCLLLPTAAIFPLWHLLQGMDSSWCFFHVFFFSFYTFYT